MFNNILVTGGLGYIGSHFVIECSKLSKSITIVDNLSNSSLNTFTKLKKISSGNLNFYQADIGDYTSLHNIFSQHEVDAVIHFAALKSIPDSIKYPEKYLANNVTGSETLISVMRQFNVNKIIFSSSASVYSADNEFPVKETASLDFTNPYSESKLIVENLLIKESNQNLNFSVGILRYFNPLGNHPSGVIGEQLTGENTNIMPMIMKSFLSNTPFKIFGNSYPSDDGTAIRDYIHVLDLVSAHSLLLKYMFLKKTKYLVFNVGLGRGVSVKQLLDCFQSTNRTKLNYVYAEPRPGDLPICYAESEKIKTVLGWRPLYNLDDMCAHSFKYMKNMDKNSNELY